MLIEVALDDLLFNRFNPRLKYSPSSVAALAKSMSMNGQLCPVMVRESRMKDKYELLFGHRRFLAAKKLGWRSIRAEVVVADDEAMIQHALVENLQRDGLSDYEKALIFERLNAEFSKTYAQIGEMVGLSKQSVSNHIAMLRLFDQDCLAKDPSLRESLLGISERHARVLATIGDPKTRANMLRLALREGLSVRDLSHLVNRLRSWFHDGDQVSGAGRVQTQQPELPRMRGARANIRKIRQIMEEKFSLAHNRDLPNLEKMYLLGNGYSVFPAFESGLLEDDSAASYHERWVNDIAPQIQWKLERVDVKLLSGSSAVAVSRLRYSGRREAVQVRGTTVFVLRRSGWKIIHEHWSKVESSVSLDSVSSLIRQ